MFPVCPECEALLERPSASEVGAALASVVLDGNGPTDIVHAAALWYYHRESPATGLHRAMKFHGARQLGVFCGQLLGEHLRSMWWETVAAPARTMVVPIPLHPVRLRDRGYNQAAAIAEGVAQRLGLVLDESALERERPSSSQVGRSRNERLRDMREAFTARPATGDDLHVLLIDDVITTGATIMSAAGALARCGWKFVSVAALALTPP